MSELERTDTPHEHSGVNLFAYEIDGNWQAGWFRIADGQLEVESGLERRAVRYDSADSDSLTDLLRQLLTDIVHGTPNAADVAEPRQQLVSASLHSGSSAFIFSADSAIEHEYQLPQKGGIGGDDESGTDGT